MSDKVEGRAGGDASHDWALVLAGGDGRRLQALTTTASGVAVPKQYCSLQGGPSLLEDALRRAGAAVPIERICAVVSAQHRRWWASVSTWIPATNIFVQPQNRGTATGILLPLLRILHRDRNATLLILPSDHYVSAPSILTVALQSAVRESRHSDDILLVGFTPEMADPELGYIVPSASTGNALDPLRVLEFVEKPSEAEARQLIARGGLWNAFILAARGQTLLEAFESRVPEVVMEMRAILEKQTTGTAMESHVADLYQRLPVLDFSRDILQWCTPKLRVMNVAPCGWSDLGTPGRVARTLETKATRRSKWHQPPVRANAFLNLAAQYAKLQCVDRSVEAAGEMR